MVIGAGNRAQDRAITRPMASALVNRMVHVELRANVDDWLTWAESAGLHSHVTDYVKARPDHLVDTPPEIEAPFSTPRAWHMLSDSLYGFGEALTIDDVATLAMACLSATHGSQFIAFVKQKLYAFRPEALLRGEQELPLKDRDLMYFVVMALRAYLFEQLPRERVRLSLPMRELVARANELIRTLTAFDGELVQLLLGQAEPERALPAWFIADLTDVLPSRLADKAAAERKAS